MEDRTRSREREIDSEYEKKTKENKSKKYLLFQFLIKKVTDFGTNLLRKEVNRLSC